MNIQNLNCLIDLHLHLDGSLPLHTVKELAEQQGITLQMTDGELKKKLSVPAGCRDLNEYLTKFEFPLTLMQTPEALEKCMHDLLTELEGQGVQYCEVRFAPQLHTQKGMSQNEVIEAVKAGLYSRRVFTRVLFYAVCVAVTMDSKIKLRLKKLQDIWEAVCVQ